MKILTEKEFKTKREFVKLLFYFIGIANLMYFGWVFPTYPIRSALLTFNTIIFLMIFFVSLTYNYEEYLERRAFKLWRSNRGPRSRRVKL